MLFGSGETGIVIGGVGEFGSEMVQSQSLQKQQ